MKLSCPPESITHLHLLSVLVTEISEKNLENSRVRVLDAGCGNGHLLTFLQINLLELFPGMELEIFGYDVGDHGVQAKDYFVKTIAWCEKHCPCVPWATRLYLISHDQNWPFESNFFDIVLSNQVLEHVWNHQHFFFEHARVLGKGGFGIHLFPLKHYIYEGHLLIPFAHRISDWPFLKSYIYLMSKLGFGKFHKQKELGIEEYSRKHADYMVFFTNYLSHSQLIKTVTCSRLRSSLKYTGRFYFHKLRKIFRQKEVVDLGRVRHYGLLSILSIHALKYVSSITLFVEKENSYGEE